MGPRLESLEVNPLLVGDGRIEALDALAHWDEETGGRKGEEQ
jgi:hypothetical protein